jgi:hypothetical protein
MAGSTLPFRLAKPVAAGKNKVLPLVTIKKIRNLKILKPIYNETPDQIRGHFLHPGRSYGRFASSKFSPFFFQEADSNIINQHQKELISYGGVYLFTSMFNAQYVGSSVQFAERLIRHLFDRTRPTRSGTSTFYKTLRRQDLANFN